MCSLHGCRDCAKQQCGDGDDGWDLAGGCERPDDDGVGSDGLELQRKLCGDVDGREYVYLFQTGANSTSTGGTVAKLTGGYVLYPMAEVLGVFDAATKSVDGQLTLAPNTVPWAANDPVEEPHYYQEAISADTSIIGQTTPRPEFADGRGEYQGNVGPG